MILLSGDEWMKNAACTGAPARLFFPGSGRGYDEGKALCATCPVREQCLDFAIETPCEDGLFGGLTYPERQALVKSRKAAS